MLYLYCCNHLSFDFDFVVNGCEPVSSSLSEETTGVWLCDLLSSSASVLAYRALSTLSVTGILPWSTNYTVLYVDLVVVRRVSGRRSLSDWREDSSYVGGPCTLWLSLESKLTLWLKVLILSCDLIRYAGRVGRTVRTREISSRELVCNH